MIDDEARSVARVPALDREFPTRIEISREPDGTPSQADVDALVKAASELLAEFNAFVFQSGVDLSDMSAHHVVNSTWRKRQLATRAALTPFQKG